MVRALNKTSIVFEDLFEKITSGFYQEGRQLPTEETLTGIYKVSRPVVRGALRALKEEGLIESVKGLGSFVKRSSSQNTKFLLKPVNAKEDMLHCFEFRSSFEGKMAFWAAKRRNARDCIQLQKAYEEAINTFNRTPEENWKTDIGFHKAIAEASHNRFYIQTLQAIEIQMLEGMSNISRFFKEDKASHARIKMVEHNLIYEGILKGDAAMAEAAMTLHLERSKNWLINPVEKRVSFDS